MPADPFGDLRSLCSSLYTFCKEKIAQTGIFPKTKRLAKTQSASEAYIVTFPGLKLPECEFVQGGTSCCETSRHHLSFDYRTKHIGLPLSEVKVSPLKAQLLTDTQTSGSANDQGRSCAPVVGPKKRKPASEQDLGSDLSHSV
jgi:hypothetical protein